MDRVKGFVQLTSICTTVPKLHPTRANFPHLKGQVPRGPFLEGPEKFSHPESRCKTLWLQSRFIHILLIWTELRSLYTRSLRHRIHLSDFRYRLIKNGPKSFRGFRETSPWSGNRSWATLVGDEYSFYSTIPATFYHSLISTSLCPR